MLSQRRPNQPPFPPAKSTFETPGGNILDECPGDEPRATAMAVPLNEALQEGSEQNRNHPMIRIPKASGALRGGAHDLD